MPRRHAAPLEQRDPPQLQGPDTVNSALSYRNMLIRSRYPHFAVHLDRPISVSSLDRCTRAVHDFGYCPLRLSEASGRLANSRSFPLSGVSAANPAADTAQLADPQQCSWQSIV
ncbi:hypothetical protein NA56DRAFT_711164 [Hyaloscypha hepaticicola]|uniref:Uncharacterized protein n=1 Tax=Hyaloscypha hepaticicola TaxID=2082293 RepID=A0A2J6PKD9_9HELO|nr:hypothetical protein NA56DRAFT_711164 [Hyaloscypha hepaticicola]